MALQGKLPWTDKGRFEPRSTLPSTASNIGGTQEHIRCNHMPSQRFFDRVDVAEHRLCLRFNGGCRRPIARAVDVLAGATVGAALAISVLTLLPI